jgi:hypothetical protein
MKRLSYFVLGGLIVMLLMGQSQCNTSTLGMKVVEAQKFIVRDGSGKSHAELTETGLTLTDGEGKILVLLTGLRNTAPAAPTELVQLSLFGSRGSIELNAGSINLKKDGPKPYLMVTDEEGNAQSFISPADINLWYAKKLRTTLTAGNSGTSISFYDPGNIPLPRVELGIDANGASLSLSDKNNKTRVVLGSTLLVTSRTGAKTITPEESLTLFDKDGKVSWATPK